LKGDLRSISKRNCESDPKSQLKSGLKVLSSVKARPSTCKKQVTQKDIMACPNPDDRINKSCRKSSCKSRQSTGKKSVQGDHKPMSNSNPNLNKVSLPADGCRGRGLKRVWLGAEDIFSDDSDQEVEERESKRERETERGTEEGIRIERERESGSLSSKRSQGSASLEAEREIAILGISNSNPTYSIPTLTLTLALSLNTLSP
jgi:hypothetical protein